MIILVYRDSCFNNYEAYTFVVTGNALSKALNKKNVIDSNSKGHEYDPR